MSLSAASRRYRHLHAVIKLGLHCAALVASGKKERLPEAIYTGFRSLGGVYVKFLQLLAFRSEAFTGLREYNIYDVYDRVSTEQLDVGKVLVAELGDASKKFVLQSDNPFAAGSFGQVYLAQYEGKTVILKILRPSVAKDLKFDLRVLGIFSRLVTWFSQSNAVDLHKTFKEFAKVTTLETDYLMEADYAATLYERYKNHPNFVIPYTYREVSTSNVICQDYIGGVAATDLMAYANRGFDAEAYISQALGSSLQQQLVALGSEILTSIFQYGSAYGDPHPGNVKFLPGNKVGLIDYGMRASAPRNKIHFHRLIEQYYKIYSGQPDIRGYSQALLNMYGGDIILAARSLDDFYSGGANNLVDRLTDMAEQIINNQHEEADYLLRNNKMATLFNSLINRDNRFCLKYDLDGPEIIRAGSLFVSLVTGLGVKNQVLMQTYASVLERTKGMALGDEQKLLHPETAVEILAGWFDQISYKNPSLYRKIRLEGVHYA